MTKGLFPGGKTADRGHAKESDRQTYQANPGWLRRDRHGLKGKSVKQCEEANAKEGDVAESQETPGVRGITAKPVFAVKQQAHYGATNDPEKHARPTQSESQRNNFHVTTFSCWSSLPGSNKTRSGSFWLMFSGFIWVLKIPTGKGMTDPAGDFFQVRSIGHWLEDELWDAPWIAPGVVLIIEQFTQVLIEFLFSLFRPIIPMSERDDSQRRPPVRGLVWIEEILTDGEIVPCPGVQEI